MKNFPAFLRDFEHALLGQAVEKAFVIRDSDGGDPRTVQSIMARKIDGRAFPFARGVQLCVVRRTPETWLLADSAAINSVAVEEGGRNTPEVNGTLEDIVDPKERLQKHLSGGRLAYLPTICGKIASRINLDTLRYRCPSFRIFEQKIHDC
jgi:hypothetical protein